MIKIHYKVVLILFFFSTIKIEPNEDEEEENLLHEETDETLLIPENFICVKSEVQNEVDIQTSLNSTEALSDDQNGKLLLDSQKYCDNCEIVFTYEHTLAAHRKFYCKALKSDKSQSTPSNSNISVAEPSALLLK